MDSSSLLNPSDDSTSASIAAVEQDSFTSAGSNATDENNFHANWQFTDTTHLRPANLPIARVQRAWERRPQSPFARQKLRAGAKLWKRGHGPHGVSINPSRDENAYTSKAVKKLCLSSGLGLGAVSQWDASTRGSPSRKIVTRSDRNAELLELDEEDDSSLTARAVDAEPEEEVDGTITEILDEEGRPLSSETDVAQDLQREDWEDVAPAEKESNESATSVVKPVSLSLPPTQEVILPEGFVSPVKQRRKLGPRRSRESSAGRRRTLPVQFAPEVSFTPEQNEVTAITPQEPAVEQSAEESQPATMEAESDEVDVSQSVEEMSEYEQDAADSEHLEPAGEDDGWEDLDEEESAEDEDEDATIAHPTRELISRDTDAPLMGSPIPSIVGQHPRLPLRRSPRRKSSSPLKQSVVQLAPETSHLVAFTPVKRPAFTVHSPANQDPEQQQEETEPMDVEEHESPLRTASEPPEEVRMSPQRSSRPRISDDTALLQAFLNKAAEKKSTRRVSTAMKESITNRRDSDTVREALASPGPNKSTDVLMELDVNSPSPRKKSFAASKDAPHANVDLSAESADSTSKPSEPEAEAEHDADATEEATTQAVPRTRSGRSRKKPQVYAPAAASGPSKISIRHNANNVDLRKTQAQEVAQLTRNNTKKNKGGSMMPLQRLTKLSSEKTTEEPAETENADAQPASKKRNIRWAEKLVEFSDASPASENSQVGSEDDAEEVEADAVAPAAPAPIDTPSKPKARRLRPTRASAAAATPSESSKSAPVAEVPAEQPTAPKATSKAKKSRIATPAKPKAGSDASLLPADVAPVAEAPAEKKPSVAQKVAPVPQSKPAEEPQQAKRKKIPTRLPAPSTTSLGIPGKENMLTASPAKKKPSMGAVKGVPSANFAPKLDFGRSVSKPANFSSSALGATPALQHPSQSTGGDSEMVPGLASPAKKGRRAAPIFPSNHGAVSAADRDVISDNFGLSSSPAKKRTRRRVF